MSGPTAGYPDGIAAEEIPLVSAIEASSTSWSGARAPRKGRIRWLLRVLGDHPIEFAVDLVHLFACESVQVVDADDAVYELARSRGRHCHGPILVLASEVKGGQPVSDWIYSRVGLFGPSPVSPRQAHFGKRSCS